MDLEFSFPGRCLFTFQISPNPFGGALIKSDVSFCCHHLYRFSRWNGRLRPLWHPSQPAGCIQQQPSPSAAPRRARLSASQTPALQLEPGGNNRNYQWGLELEKVKYPSRHGRLTCRASLMPLPMTSVSIPFFSTSSRSAGWTPGRCCGPNGHLKLVYSFLGFFSACLWKWCWVVLTSVPVSLQSQARLPPGQTLQSL